jgi:hypothetical protein
MQEELKKRLGGMPLRVNGFVVSNCKDFPAIFVLGEQTANKLADLLRKNTNKPEWVNVRKASFTKCGEHQGWYQDIPMHDTKELILEAIRK